MTLAVRLLCYVQPVGEDPKLPRLKEAALLYERHLVARSIAASTAHTRLLTVMALIQVVGDLDTARVEAVHVDRLFTAKAEWAPGTRNNHQSHLRLFFEWCRFRGFMRKDSDPLFGWSHQKYSTPDRLRIPVTEWERLFGACSTEIQKIIIATGLFLFLRSSEQQAIQLKHVHLDRSEIEIYRKKTRDHDTMPISSELDSYLRPHLVWLAGQGISHPDHYLIPTRTYPRNSADGTGFIAGTGKLNPDRAFLHPHRYVQRVLAKAGYPTHQEGEHTLRRSGARAYFDSLVSQGYDGALRRVQSMLGHKNAAMTEHYLGLTLDRQRRNNDLRGQPMFPALQDVHVIPLREVVHG